MGEQIYSYVYQTEIGIFQNKTVHFDVFSLYFYGRLILFLYIKSATQTHVCINEMLFHSLL